MPDYAGRSGPPTKGAPEAWGATAAPPKNAGHMWRCAAALSHTLVQVFDHVSYILLYAGVTATGGSIEWVVVWGD